MEYAVIMAGGSGTRLWPLSRRGMPKQLLTLIDGRSLLQLAYERAITVVDPSRVVICAGQAYADVIAGQLPDLPRANLLLEPVGRDSLAAVAWSVATILGRDADAVVAVLTADHIITPQANFSAALRQALATADTPGTLVTFAVAPTGPVTSYGYLQTGVSVDPQERVLRVLRFAEKPTRQMAERYLADGHWWWNSGMFCWRADSFWQQLVLLQPDLARDIDKLVGDPTQIDQIYPGLTKTSVDYAIMEPVSVGVGSAQILAVPLDAQWADVGGYPALARQLGLTSGNASEGRVVALESAGNLILNRSSDGRLVAVAALTDMIVVVDDDVTLVCPMNQAESIKQLVELAREQGERYV